MSAAFDALVAETRELRRTLHSYEARLRAIEASRWWRLHPRRLLGTRVAIDPASPAAPTHVGPPATPADQTPLTEDDSLTAFKDAVAARGAFTDDWVTTRFSPWRPIFDELDGRPTEILEIGSFEGLSACFFLWRFPLAKVTCIDTFVGTPETAGTTLNLEKTFDANVALVDASRVRKLVGDSKRRLLDLTAEGASFELIYVDGSHLGLDVLVDAALSWNLLADRGVVVFDDYRWAYLGNDPLLRPGKAIDAFREIIDEKHDVVFANGQIALRRTR